MIKKKSVKKIGISAAIMLALLSVFAVLVPQTHEVTALAATETSIYQGYTRRVYPTENLFSLKHFNVSVNADFYNPLYSVNPTTGNITCLCYGIPFTTTLRDLLPEAVVGGTYTLSAYVTMVIPFDKYGSEINLKERHIGGLVSEDGGYIFDLFGLAHRDITFTSNVTTYITNTFTIKDEEMFKYTFTLYGFSNEDGGSIQWTNVQCNLGKVAYPFVPNADSQSLYESVYEQGRKEGYSKGWNSGYDSAKEWYSEINSSIYSKRYNQGYSDGLAAAEDATFSKLIFAVIDVPISSFTEMFNFEILGVNMTVFMTSLLSFMLVFAIIRLLVGKR